VATEGYVILKLRVYPEGKQWVSECLELGVTSCGDTIEEALGNIRDAVTLYLNTIEEQGEIARTFRERGVVVHSGDPPDEEIPVWARSKEVVSPYVAKVPVAV
jgi:predicted RNase H-like HicB family nuclease